MNRRTALKLSLTAVVSSLVLASPNVLAANSNGPTYTDKKGRAINGYDTVAYFTKKKAIKGNPKFQTSWNHGTWFFSSQENLELFKRSPEKYAPQYGGYCAYAVSLDRLVQIDPTQFTIIGQKLYLTYHPRIQRRWDKKRADYLIDSEKNWPKLLKKVQKNI
ncbi:MAG: YHS domain-containing (seleno)protein [Arenicella sp.]